MLYIAYGLTRKLETQVLLADELGFMAKGNNEIVKASIAEVERRK